jgi:glycerol-3-phosphate cytidylyltransferase
MFKVYVGGTFDIFHVGHVNLLRAAHEIGGEGRVMVALNSDEFVRQFKGEYPINNWQSRAAVLRSCKYVDHVVEHTNGNDSKPGIEGYSPRFIVVGTDWAEKDYYAQMGFDQAWLDARGIRLVYVPYTKGISSTKLRRHIVEE